MKCEDRFGWIEPEIAQYPKSTQLNFVLARGGPVPIRSSHEGHKSSRLKGTQAQGQRRQKAKDKRLAAIPVFFQ